MALVQYTTVGVKLDIHIQDYYAVNSTFAAKDDAFAIQQGSQDVVLVLSAYDASQYYVGSMKRKYATGDTNRDQIVSSNDNTYCFIYGNALAFSTFVQSETQCFNFTLTTQYTSNFRETSSTSVNVQTYQPPSSNVKVVTVGESYLFLALAIFSLLVLVI